MTPNKQGYNKNKTKKTDNVKVVEVWDCCSDVKPLPIEQMDFLLLQVLKRFLQKLKLLVYFSLLALFAFNSVYNNRAMEEYTEHTHTEYRPLTLRFIWPAEFKSGWVALCRTRMWEDAEVAGVRVTPSGVETLQLCVASTVLNSSLFCAISLIVNYSQVSVCICVSLWNRSSFAPVALRKELLVFSLCCCVIGEV